MEGYFLWMTPGNFLAILGKIQYSKNMGLRGLKYINIWYVQVVMPIHAVLVYMIDNLSHVTVLRGLSRL